MLTPIEMLMLAGIGVNVLATLGSWLSVLLRYERRIVTMETHLLHLMPKRDSDERQRA